MRQDSKEFVHQDDNDKNFVAVVKQLYDQKAKAGKLTFKNYFYPERGPFDLVSVMDESVCEASFVVRGMFDRSFRPETSNFV